MLEVHPTALVSPHAKIGEGVSIGPFCIVEAHAEIGDHCSLASRAIVKEGCILGTHNEVAEGAVLGGRPQHLAAGDRVGRVIIGNHNCIRENVTIHRALDPEAATRVGDACLLMVNVHVAHDCVLGNKIIATNNCMLGGHVEIGDQAYIGGGVGVHQFCRIGRLAMVGGYSIVTQDVPPFVLVDGRSGLIAGLNRIGLRRSGMGSEEIQQLKKAYRLIFRTGLTWNETLDALDTAYQTGPAAEFRPFLASAKRGVVSERRVPHGATVALPSNADTSANQQTRKAG